VVTIRKEEHSISRPFPTFEPLKGESRPVGRPSELQSKGGRPSMDLKKEASAHLVRKNTDPVKTHKGVEKKL